MGPCDRPAGAIAVCALHVAWIDALLDLLVDLISPFSGISDRMSREEAERRAEDLLAAWNPPGIFPALLPLGRISRTNPGVFRS
jgi:hypothetical protein